MGAYGTAKALAYGRVRATGVKWIDQTNVLEGPQISHYYSNGDTLSDGTYLQFCEDPGLSGSTLPSSWNATVGGTTTWGGATFINQGSTNGSGTQYGLWVLGEGEWDGFDRIWNQGSAPLFVIGGNYDISTGTYAVFGAGGAGLGLNPPLIHFHSGTDGALGSSLPVPSSNGPDQGCDNWIADLPAGAAIIAQCYSRMAYYMASWLPQDLIGNVYGSAQINQTGQTMNLIGDWRALRCRIFDDMGNQVGYGWTQNPAWHYVDAWIRCALMPRSEYQLVMSDGPPYTTTPEALTSDVTDKFDWGSIYEFAQDCDYVLANGSPRFIGNYAFAAQTTLAAVLEKILQCSRGYQQEYAGKLFLNMDKPRASVFVLTDQHQLPYTLAVDNKEVHQNANDVTVEFLDTNLPAVQDISTIDFVYPGPGPYATTGQATIVTPTENPVAPWDIIQVGDSSNPLLNRQWMVNNITDDYTFTAQPLAPNLTSDETATGGVFGYPQSRFNKRSPELIHQDHAVARGQIGR